MPLPPLLEWALSGTRWAITGHGGTAAGQATHTAAEKTVRQWHSCGPLSQERPSGGGQFSWREGVQVATCTVLTVCTLRPINFWTAQACCGSHIYLSELCLRVLLRWNSTIRTYVCTYRYVHVAESLDQVGEPDNVCQTGEPDTHSMSLTNTPP